MCLLQGDTLSPTIDETLEAYLIRLDAQINPPRLPHPNPQVIGTDFTLDSSKFPPLISNASSAVAAHRLGLTRGQGCGLVPVSPGVGRNRDIGLSMRPAANTMVGVASRRASLAREALVMSDSASAATFHAEATGIWAGMIDV